MSIRLDAGRGEHSNHGLGHDEGGIRQQILGIVREQTGAISERALAAQLAASDPELDADDAEAVSSLRVRLYHLHLPKLDDSGLVDWDRDAEAVAATDESADSTRRFETAESADSDESIDAAPADDRRREIVSIVRSEDEPVSREDIARELAEGQADGEAEASLVDDIAVRLHHHHLPKLDDAGFVEYDVDSATVTYRGSQ